MSKGGGAVRTGGVSGAGTCSGGFGVSRRLARRWQACELVMEIGRDDERPRRRAVGLNAGRRRVGRACGREEAAGAQGGSEERSGEQQGELATDLPKGGRLWGGGRWCVAERESGWYGGVSQR